MDMQVAVLVTWLAVPLLMFVGAKVVIRRSKRRAIRVTVFDPLARLEQLRAKHELVQGGARGRMVEALRLAEDPAGSPVLQLHQ